ncbi:MAG: DUF6382 domain-containing protein [Eubacteriales bacterium]|nr:DUF6382 domain-containing protein [Eubacteriales bacterium]MDD3199915.1 DUF6382 domain-containing protein [Eubacteriales bacterium]MDD4630424.1 DUF6382 domain-containing protein [Eubacteriales bacterium]
MELYNNIKQSDEKVIHIVSTEGQIIEMAGKRKFCIQFNDTDIQEYEKKILSESGCSNVLSMNFLTTDRTTKAWYDYTGYLQLKEYIRKASCIDFEREYQNQVHDALNILSKILQCIKDLEDYLILYDRISVNPDTIFINQHNGSIALAFYPNDMTQLTFRERLISTMNTISEWYKNTEADQCIIKFQNVIFEKNLGLDGMISTLGMIQRDMSYIYCNSNYLRKPVIAEDTNTSAAKSMKSKRALLKPVFIQVLFILLLACANFFELLKGSELAGLAVIFTGIDLWIMKHMKYLKTSKET